MHGGQKTYLAMIKIESLTAISQYVACANAILPPDTTVLALPSSGLSLLLSSWPTHSDLSLDTFADTAKSYNRQNLTSIFLKEKPLLQT